MFACNAFSYILPTNWFFTFLFASLRVQHILMFAFYLTFFLQIADGFGLKLPLVFIYLGFVLIEIYWGLFILDLKSNLLLVLRSNSFKTMSLHSSFSISLFEISCLSTFTSRFNLFLRLNLLIWFCLLVLYRLNSRLNCVYVYFPWFVRAIF